MANQINFETAVLKVLPEAYTLQAFEWLKADPTTGEIDVLCWCGKPCVVSKSKLVCAKDAKKCGMSYSKAGVEYLLRNKLVKSNVLNFPYCLKCKCCSLELPVSPKFKTNYEPVFIDSCKGSLTYTNYAQDPILKSTFDGVAIQELALKHRGVVAIEEQADASDYVFLPAGIHSAKAPVATSQLPASFL